jgi:lytic murein transglycosylase
MTRLILRHLSRALAGAAVLAALVASSPGHAADAAFQQWLAGLWPDAEKMGISRATFDTATRGLEPDMSLPDLIIPGRPARPSGRQAEFVQAPADYIKESSIEHLAAEGRKLLEQNRTTLAGIEKQFGVPGPILLAIWGRETDFGRAKDSLSAIRVLATQAYLGRRKDQFRQEFLIALKMVDEGDVPLAQMKSSWAGAMGLTQFMPSDYVRSAVDFDGDGRRNIWTSVPDALASAAKQLVDKGWQRGEPWAIEVHAPRNTDCTIGVPENTMPIGEWLRLGYTPAYGRKLSDEEMNIPASLLQPAGLYGPSFLTPKNYFVIKEYNFSDLYVLFVGHLGDRIAQSRGFETPWSKVVQLPTVQVESMQRRLTNLGLYADKIDGKAGMKTRAALGAYQKANGLVVDCWPTTAVLQHMQSTAGSN